MARASRRYGRLARAFLSAGFLIACSHKDAPPAPASSASASASVAIADAGSRPHTTSPKIAYNNLNIDIAGRQQAYDKQPTAEALSRLIGSLSARQQFAGKMSDLETIDHLTIAALKDHVSDPQAHLSRASALSAVHKFALALGELSNAEHLGAPADKVKEARASIFQATGKYDDALKIRTDHDTSLDLPAAIVSHAELAGEMQNVDESEKLFAEARAKYRDVSPFFVGWMDFQHASLLERRGERDEAKRVFAEAVQVLPSYTHAAVHLAALETPERALEILTPLVDTTDDADVLAGMADALRRTGKTADATAMQARAKARYDELLKKYPEAFADHAATFYLGPQGDVKLALSLAKSNEENRKTEPSVELLMTAALANNSHDAICLAVREGATLKYTSPPFRANFAPLAPGCGVDAGVLAIDAGSK
ncbi:MAG: tetratricopeptide repeat protein [Polyangiaceae bacterium]